MKSKNLVDKGDTVRYPAKKPAAYNSNIGRSMHLCSR